MKKFIALFLVLAMSLSLVACGNKTEEADTLTNVEVNGVETTVKDFLVENLNKYIQSENYLSMVKGFEDSTGQEAREFAVTNVVELKVNGIGGNSIDLHFLLVKAQCDIAVPDGFNDAISLVVDYETGEVYDQYTRDASWEGKDTKEGYLYMMFDTCFVSSDYDDDAIFSDDIETRTKLTDKALAEINAELNK